MSFDDDQLNDDVYADELDDFDDDADLKLGEEEDTDPYEERFH